MTITGAVGGLTAVQSTDCGSFAGFVVAVEEDDA